MGFYRVFPLGDTWITNRSGKSVLHEFSGSNHGRSPALNVYSLEPETFSGSVDLARILLQFNVTELSGKIYDEQIISSSSVSYFLRMFDMKHGDTIPESYDLFVYPMSRSFDFGNGIDDDNHRDDGVANWDQATSTTNWTTTGSDFLTTEYGSGSQHFDQGQEDLEMNITDIMVNWLTGTLNENGIVVKLGDVEESASSDYFRKVFHGRETKFIDKMPYIEARWDDVLKDNRGNFAYDQDSSLYLYNLVRGELTDVTEPISVRFQDHVDVVSASYNSVVTAARVEVGIYSASLNVMNTSSFSASWIDVWFSGAVSYMSAAFTPLVLTGSQIDPYDEFDVAISNLKRIYSSTEDARLIVSVRKRDFVTHVGSITSASLGLIREREYIEKMYYSIENDETGEVVVPYGTGSIPYTQLSYNGDGNYFNLFMQNFVPGFLYRIKFLIDINRFDKKVVDDGFVFKIV